ncbi:MAG: hypothetical protein ABEH64_05815 [Salinirussus sp.]
MVGESGLSLAFAALGVPFLVTGVLWLLSRLVLNNDEGGDERSVPEPNRQSRSIPGTGN